MKAIIVLGLTLALSGSLWARKKHAFGAFFSSTSASQDDVNTLIARVNQVSPITATPMGSAYELVFHYSYQFGRSMYALEIRPSYFYQRSDGSGTGGDYKYGLTGFTLFPSLRITPLANKFIKFFFHFGLGYGSLSGDLQEASESIKYGGAAFGAMLGLGTEFCFTKNHCMGVEGNFRYLPIVRNIVSSTSGDLTDNGGNITQHGDTQEFEFDNKDVITTMSGIMGMVGYIYRF